MGNVLIIAYGNPLRCDDGLAWRAAEELECVPFSVRPVIHTCFQLTPELALQVSAASTVVFVDAGRTGEPGSLSMTEVFAKQESSVFTHEFSPSSILALSQELYAKRPLRAVSLSMSGQCFEHGEQLSDRVRDNLPGLVSAIQRVVEQATTPDPQDCFLDFFVDEEKPLKGRTISTRSVVVSNGAVLC